MAEIAAQYRMLADASASLFGPLVEVAVHDLEADTMAYIANPMSPCGLGEPSHFRSLGMPGRNGFTGPYETTNWDGRRPKSVSVVLPGAPAVMLCINTDVSSFDTLCGTLEIILKPAARRRW